MTISIVDSRPSAEQRLKDEAAEAAPRRAKLAKADTALARKLNATQANWLLNHVTTRYEALYAGMRPWREKMDRWERMSEGNYADRAAKIKENGLPDVFAYQNDTMGMSQGFADYFTAQARNDVFGTYPWMAAKPVGRDDPEFAEEVTRHSQWKLGQSNLEPTLRDAFKIAGWGGTAFVKSRWRREEEVYETTVTAAFSKETGEPYRTASGELVMSDADFAGDEDGNDVEWKETSIEKTITVTDNACNEIIDHKDIAFEPKASELNLLNTDVFLRVRMGFLDVMRHYGIPEDKRAELKSSANEWNDRARDHRNESSTTEVSTESSQENANPPVEIVEGFVRCDVLGTGRPVRLYVVFSPGLQTIFTVDYLAAEIPDGIVPVFPVRIDKIPGRIFGVGYFEKYEQQNDSVDRKHNAVGIRAKHSAHVWTAIQREALRDPNQSVVSMDPDHPVELADGKTMDDFLSFKTMPDMDDRTLQLADREMQMCQMRSGITSAAQGELKGVPSASTATGVNDIISRGAVLMKDPVDQLTDDAQSVVEFNVILLYANQDRDETFTWSEGRNTKLVSIKADDVRGLRADVTLTMVQAQNQTKLASAQTAIAIAKEYAALPEVEKTAQRRLYVQAIASLGFNDAEDIIRPATVDVAGILAMVPPDAAPAVQAAMESAGLVMPEAPAPTEGLSAPGIPQELV